MKYIGRVALGISLVAFVFLISVNGLYLADGRAQLNAEAYTVFLKSRIFTPPPGISPQVRSHITLLAATPGARDYLITQFKDIPSVEEREVLEGLGIKLLGYVPNYAWFASVPASEGTLEELENIPFHRATFEILARDKIAPSIIERGVGEWAKNPDGTANLIIMFFKDISLDIARQIASAYGGRVISELSLLNSLTVAIPEEKIQDLADESRVQWINEVPPPPEPDNDGIRAAIGVETVQTAPYSLDGTGVIVGEWDGGWVDYTHDDLAGRVTIGDNGCEEIDCRTDDHATHVAGTVAGDGTLSADHGGSFLQWRGMAPNARVVSYEWWLTLSNNRRVIDILECFKEYTDAVQNYHIDLSTNSWGYDHGGYYEEGSLIYDVIIRGGLGRPITILGSAGNRGEGGWQTTRVPNSAKNTIVVGATDSANGKLCPFSSRGPTADGRIKPDIVAPGCQRGGDWGITSTVPPDTYDAYSGTSMSTPAVAGSIALLLQQYRMTFASNDPLPSTLKALLIGTARDRGNRGPDFKYGYGEIDVKTAVDLIKDQPDYIVEEAISSADEVDTYPITVPSGVSELKVTLVWDDLPGTINARPTLVNDLDLELIGPDGEVYYPWILDPVNREAPATTGPDHTNNVEQVQIENPSAGEWKVIIKGYRMPFSSRQDYSLVIYKK